MERQNKMKKKNGGDQKNCNFRTTLSDGPIFGRNVFHLRHRGHLFCNERWRGKSRSCHLHFPSNDQMHFSQIWSFWKHREPRRSLHFTHQHCQRKNLHFYLVLVSHIGHSYNLGSIVQVNHYFFSSDASLSFVHPISTDPKRMHQHHHQEDSNGRLVFALHVGTERGLDDLQGSCAWTLKTFGIPSKRSHWLLASFVVPKKIIKLAYLSRKMIFWILKLTERNFQESNNRCFIFNGNNFFLKNLILI